MEKFIVSPNLPQSKVSLAVLDSRAGSAIIKNLEDMGVHVILCPPCTYLYDAVSCHPDMLIHHLGHNHIVAAPNAPAELLEELIKHGLDIVKGEKFITGKYPDDIAYNVARIENYAICNVMHTDKTLLRCLLDRGVKLVDVKQGYSKCSLSIIDSNSVITSDEGLYAVLAKYDFDVLKIRPGFIDLTGLHYGFIGGSSGLVSKGTLAFTGNIALHPDFEMIKKFLSQHGKTEKALDLKKLMDLGTIIPLKEYSIEEIC